MAADEAENSGNQPSINKQDQVIQDLIQKRKLQLGALNKIMSSITKQTDHSSTEVNETVRSNGHPKNHGKIRT